MSCWYDKVTLPMKPLGDAEGPRVPESLPEVIDAHVHLFPERVFQAIWRWFEQHAWEIRYKLTAEKAAEFLFARGVTRIVALHYAHKPGLARGFNQFVAELAKNDPRITALATVMPGEEGAADILREAFAMGLKGVKVHCHVQCFSPDDPKLHEVFDACARAQLPLVMHAGREPAIPAYKCDPYALCAAERVEHVLRDWPRLKLCVPHLGADEYDAYEKLVTRYDNLWLDTTMACADFFPAATPVRLLHARPERIMYGTDFPGLPFAWDRELVRLAKVLKPGALESVLGKTARAFFGMG